MFDPVASIAIWSTIGCPAFTDSAPPGVVNVASSRNFSLKFLTISRFRATTCRDGEASPRPGRFMVEVSPPLASALHHGTDHDSPGLCLPARLLQCRQEE